MKQLIAVSILVWLANGVHADDLSTSDSNDLLRELGNRVGATAKSAKVYWYCDDWSDKEDFRSYLHVAAINEFGARSSSSKIVSAAPTSLCNDQIATLRAHRTEITKYTEFALCLRTEPKPKVQTALYLYVVTPTPNILFAQLINRFDSDSACVAEAKAINSK